MSTISRGVYFAVLIVAAMIYVAVMPPDTLNVASLIKYVVPATGVGILISLAHGVMGHGFTDYVGAIILVVVVVSLVSVTLTSTGLVLGVKQATALLNSSNLTNLSALQHILP